MLSDSHGMQRAAPCAFLCSLLAFFSEVNMLLVRLSSWLEEQGTSAEEFTSKTRLKEHAQMVVVLGLIARKFKVRTGVGGGHV